MAAAADSSQSHPKMDRLTQFNSVHFRLNIEERDHTFLMQSFFGGCAAAVIIAVVTRAFVDYC